MYRCSECDKEFEHPVKLAVLDGEYCGAPFVEYRGTCPYCKSMYISEIVYRCDCCNIGLVDGDIYYKTEDGLRFCEECITRREVGR